MRKFFNLLFKIMLWIGLFCYNLIVIGFTQENNSFLGVLMYLVIFNLIMYGLYRAYNWKKNKPSSSKSHMENIVLEKVDINVLKHCHANNILDYNFKLINHYKLGERYFVYPAGTIGGGHVGIVEKKYESRVKEDTRVLGLDYSNNTLYMTIEK